MFEFMEIADKVYGGTTTSKITTRAETDRASHGRRCKGGEATSPNITENFHALKQKKNNAVHSINWSTSDTTWLFHVPEHSTAECKVLKEYYNNYAMQWPQKEPCSGDRKNCGKGGKFNIEMQKVNTIVSHNKTYTQKKGKKD